MKLNITVFAKTVDLAVDPMQNILFDYSREYVDTLQKEIEMYDMPFKVINYTSLGIDSYAEALRLAGTVRENSFLHIALRVRKNREPLKWASRLYIQTSEFDQTLVREYFVRNFDHWGLRPWMMERAYQNEYYALKQGVTPLNIYLGNYHDLNDIAAIEKLLPRVTKASARALISYLYPIFYKDVPNDKPPTAATSSVEESKTREEEPAKLFDFPYAEQQEVPFK